QREMGFSYFIALGDSLDIDVDELLDFLARDGKTSAILLYLEHLSDAPRFVSAAGPPLRQNPKHVIKNGPSPSPNRILETQNSNEKPHCLIQNIPTPTNAVCVYNGVGRLN
ncbi:hypothetical protein ACVGWV_18940, partial [Enterobacter asburiae]